MDLSAAAAEVERLEAAAFHLCTYMLFGRALSYSERRNLDDLRHAYAARLPMSHRVAYIAHGLKCGVNVLSIALTMLDKYVPSCSSSSTVFAFAETMRSLEGWATIPLVSLASICPNPLCEAQLPPVARDPWRKDCERQCSTVLFWASCTVPYYKSDTACVYGIVCEACGRAVRMDRSVTYGDDRHSITGVFMNEDFRTCFIFEVSPLWSQFNLRLVSKALAKCASQSTSATLIAPVIVDDAAASVRKLWASFTGLEGKFELLQRGLGQYDAAAGASVSRKCVSHAWTQRMVRASLARAVRDILQ